MVAPPLWTRGVVASRRSWLPSFAVLVPSCRLPHLRATGEHLGSFEGDARQGVERHFTEIGQRREKWQADIGDAVALVELHLLERRHAAENLQAAIRDLCQTRVVILDSQISDVLRGD